MKKFLSLIFACLIIVCCFTGCNKYKGIEFCGVVIGSYKDYISVATLDERVDFYDANIAVNVSGLDFKVKNGQVLKIVIDERGKDDFDVVKIVPQTVELIDYKVQNITAEDAYDIKDEVTFVDARSKDEYNLGHIENAVLLTYKTMEKNYKTVLPKKDAKIIVYAGSEETAMLTASHLIAFGYKNVYSLGDIDGWNFGFTV